MNDQPYMVEQIIKYSDGTETSIKYRGVIVDGVLQSEKVEDSQADESIVITQEDLDEHPVLAENGVEVGDVGIPVDAPTEVPVEIPSQEATDSVSETV